jgi:salicylate hydroxylase
LAGLLTSKKPWYLAHRVDLHNEVKTLAIGNNGIGEEAKIRLSSKVIDIDPQAGTVKLADDTVHHADLIVGADGIHVSLWTSPSILGILVYRSIKKVL